MTIKRKSITFRVSDGSATALDGKILARDLYSALGPEPDDYATIKRKQMRSLGYDSHPIKGRISIEAKNNSEILDILLGLRTGHLKRFEADEVRFGIPIPKVRERDLSFRITPRNGRKCSIAFTTREERPSRLIFPGEMFLAGSGNPAGENVRVRLISDLVEVVVDKRSSEASITILAGLNDSLPVEDVLTLAQMRRNVAWGKFSISVRTPEQHLIKVHIDTSTDLEHLEQLDDRIKLLRNLQSLLHHAGERSLRMSEREVFLSSQILRFPADTRVSPNDVELSFRLDTSSTSPPLPESAEGILASKFESSGESFAFYARMLATISHDQAGVLVRCEELSLRDIVRLDDSHTFEEFISDAQNLTGLDLLVRSDALTWSKTSEGQITG